MAAAGTHFLKGSPKAADACFGALEKAPAAPASPKPACLPPPTHTHTRTRAHTHTHTHAETWAANH
eukprot:542881-Prorocentrum_lima.AAC.1